MRRDRGRVARADPSGIVGRLEDDERAARVLAEVDQRRWLVDRQILRKATGQNAGERRGAAVLDGITLGAERGVGRGADFLGLDPRRLGRGLRLLPAAGDRADEQRRDQAEQMRAKALAGSKTPPRGRHQNSVVAPPPPD